MRSTLATACGLSPERPPGCMFSRRSLSSARKPEIHRLSLRGVSALGRSLVERQIPVGRKPVGLQLVPAQVLPVALGDGKAKSPEVAREVHMDGGRDRNAGRSPEPDRTRNRSRPSANWGCSREPLYHQSGKSTCNSPKTDGDGARRRYPALHGSRASEILCAV